jgi:hypothetical protein
MKKSLKRTNFVLLTLTSVIWTLSIWVRGCQPNEQKNYQKPNTIFQNSLLTMNKTNSTQLML